MALFFTLKPVVMITLMNKRRSSCSDPDRGVGKSESRLKWVRSSFISWGKLAVCVCLNEGPLSLSPLLCNPV